MKTGRSAMQTGRSCACLSQRRNKKKSEWGGDRARRKRLLVFRQSVDLVHAPVRRKSKRDRSISVG